MTRIIKVENCMECPYHSRFFLVSYCKKLEFYGVEDARIKCLAVGFPHNCPLEKVLETEKTS